MSAEWVAVVIAVLGMLGSLVGALWANGERRRADSAADRAERRAEEAVEALRGIESALSGPAVDFDVRYRSGDQFELVNTGHGAVTGVTATSTDESIIRDLPIGVALAPGEGHLILMMGVHQLRVECDQLPAAKVVTVPPKRR